ncbi:MAG: hypothetical protein IPN29_21400 [Saprospiraceae bacterium]|nr:hypothetical protein [Saprospiraceae bacterium]
MPEKKSRPKRSIIVLVSMLISLMASVTGVLLINSWKQRS